MAGGSALQLPAANEFSPGQVDLRRVIQIVETNAGDRRAIVEALRMEYQDRKAQRQSDPAKRLRVQRTLASNILVGLAGYQLFDPRSNRLTAAGSSLLRTTTDEQMHRDFALHILNNCHGLEVLKAVRAISLRGDKPSKASLQLELEGMGFKLPRATTHHTKVLGWLGAAGIVQEGYRIDDDVLASIVGSGMEPIDDWAYLTGEQRAFLRALRETAEIGGSAPIASKAIVDKAEVQFGRIFKADQLAAHVYRPLASDGWITVEARTEGRGAKSPKVAATDKLLQVPVSVLTGTVEWGIPPDLRQRLNTPLAEIRDGLRSQETHEKGIALELLALRLATDLGLVPIKFRLRADETGGAEVDLVADGGHLHFSRWLFQCKNSSSVDLAALAREIGIATLLRSHVIVMISTGRFRSSVKKHADALADATSLQVVLVDGDDLDKYLREGTAAVLSHFHQTALGTMRLKTTQIQAVTQGEP